MFDGRAQRPVPYEAYEILEIIPDEFVDDGCSNSPDSFFGFCFRWACRIHDWRYCSRCHPPVQMTQAGRQKADDELRRFVRTSLPWRWAWVSWLYWRAVRRAGGMSAWNSCGPSVGERCRHGMPIAQWMRGAA